MSHGLFYKFSTLKITLFSKSQPIGFILQKTLTFLSSNLVILIEYNFIYKKGIQKNLQLVSPTICKDHKHIKIA